MQTISKSEKQFPNNYGKPKNNYGKTILEKKNLGKKNLGKKESRKKESGEKRIWEKVEKSGKRLENQVRRSPYLIFHDLI